MGAFLDTENKRSYLRLSPKTFYKIEFEWKNDEVDGYEMGVENIIKDGMILSFKEIHFDKVWQKYEFIGP